MTKLKNCFLLVIRESFTLLLRTIPRWYRYFFHNGDYLSEKWLCEFYKNDVRKWGEE